VSSSSTVRQLPAGYSERLGLLADQLAAELLGRAESLSEFDLTTREYTALAVLARDCPGSQHELGRLMGLAPQLVVSLTDRLEERGLVARRTNPHDRRRTLVELTRRGRRALADADEATSRVEEEVLARLAPREREELQYLLQRALGKATPDSSAASDGSRR
jgi:MarR family transcriptional regulator, lower aerobic nicotinate degradation pathway regulator